MVIAGGWMELLPEKSVTGLLQVQESPNHGFDTASKYCFLKECAPYNVLFLPQSPDPQDPNCDTYAVIDRYRMLFAE